MKVLVPSYYPWFKCISRSCRHNCCIGWEIDIDSGTLDYYRKVGGDFGVRLRDSIDQGECAHFCLTEEDRCPFLNSENLCDIHINLGEEHLSQICTDHPRFRNYIGGRCETGLGLSCEAVGKLIFSSKEKTEWMELKEDDEETESNEWERELLDNRQAVTDILQNRDKTTDERIGELYDDLWFGRDVDDWRDFFTNLERMDDGWSDMLVYLNDENASWQKNVLSESLPEYMWEQLLVYFVNRHIAPSSDEWDFRARLGFCVIGYAVIRTILEGIAKEKGKVTDSDLVEIARMYSSEIEYSEENTDALIYEIDGLI